MSIIITVAITAVFLCLNYNSRYYLEPDPIFRSRDYWPDNLLCCLPGHGTLPNAWPYARQPHRAEWIRGEVIRRLIAGQRPCGLSHFAPGLGNPFGCSLGVRSGPTRMRAAPPRYPPDPCRAARGLFAARDIAWEMAPRLASQAGKTSCSVLDAQPAWPL